MHLTVQILPLSSGPANKHFQPAGKGIISLTVLVKPDQTFLKVWSEIERVYARNYVLPGQPSPFQIKKLQNIHGADIDLEYTVGDFFEGETAAKIIQVVQAPVDRETSVLVTSNLRPHLYGVDKRKRLLEEQEHMRKRRKREEEEYGQTLEDLDPDRPVRSSETYIPDGNMFAIPESPNAAGQKARQFQGAYQEDIVIQDSQPEGQMDREMNGRTIDHINGYVDEEDAVGNGTIPGSSVHARDIDLNLPVHSPELGDQDHPQTAPAPVFKKPALPASGARKAKTSAQHTPTSAASVERAPSSPSTPFAPPSENLDTRAQVTMQNPDVAKRSGERQSVYDAIENPDEPHEQGASQLQSARAIKSAGQTDGAAQQHGLKRLKLACSAGPSSRNRHPLLQQFARAQTPKVNGDQTARKTLDFTKSANSAPAQATAGSDAPEQSPNAVTPSEGFRHNSPMTSAEKLQKMREMRFSNDSSSRNSNTPTGLAPSSNAMPAVGEVAARSLSSRDRDLEPEDHQHIDEKGFVEVDGDLSDEIDDELYEEASRQVEQYLKEHDEAQLDEELQEQAAAAPTSVKKPAGRKRGTAPNHQQARRASDQSKSAGRRDKWTPAEDQILLSARNQGEGWPAILSRFPGRTREGCSGRLKRLTGSKGLSAPAAGSQQPDLQQWLGSDGHEHAHGGSSQQSGYHGVQRNEPIDLVANKESSIAVKKPKESKKRKAAHPDTQLAGNISHTMHDHGSGYHHKINSTQNSNPNLQQEQPPVTKNPVLTAQDPKDGKSKADVRHLTTSNAQENQPVPGGDVRALMAIVAKGKERRKGLPQWGSEPTKASSGSSSSKLTAGIMTSALRKSVRRSPSDDIVISSDDEEMPDVSHDKSRRADIAAQNSKNLPARLENDYAAQRKHQSVGTEKLNVIPHTAADRQIQMRHEAKEYPSSQLKARVTVEPTIANGLPRADHLNDGQALDGTQSDEYELPTLFDQELLQYASQSSAPERDIPPSPAASDVSDRSPARYVSGSPEAVGQSSSEDEEDKSSQSEVSAGDESHSINGAERERIAVREDGEERPNEKEAAGAKSIQAAGPKSSAGLVNGHHYASATETPKSANIGGEGKIPPSAAKQNLIDDEAEKASASSSEYESEDEESELEKSSADEGEQDKPSAPSIPRIAEKPKPASPEVTSRHLPDASNTPLPPSAQRIPRIDKRSSLNSEPSSSIPVSTPITSQTTIHAQPRKSIQRELPSNNAPRKDHSILQNGLPTPPFVQSHPVPQRRTSPRLNKTLPSQALNQRQNGITPRPMSAVSKFPASLSELRSRHSTPLNGKVTPLTNGITGAARATLVPAKRLSAIPALSQTHSISRHTTSATFPASKRKSESESSESSSGSGSENDDDDDEDQPGHPGPKANANGLAAVNGVGKREAEKGTKNRYQGLMKSMYSLLSSPFTSSATR